jgi:hypothetical protein
VANVTMLVRRREGLIQQRRNHEPDWRDIGIFMLPRKSAIGYTQAAGARITSPRLMDSTAIRANELLAASMQGSLTSTTSRWYSLQFRDPLLGENAEARDWLDDCTERLYKALQNSNMGAEMHEMYLDLGAFGTAALLLDEENPEATGFEGFRFTAIQIGEYAIAEDRNGRVNTFFRDFKLSADAAKMAWGDAVGERISKIAAKTPDEMVTISHAVYPRVSGAKGYARRASKAKPWASCYFDADAKHLIHEGGFDEFPYMVPRWAKASGEVYGRGPGHTALPDVKTLNKAVELTLKAWAKAIDPPLKAKDDGVIGQVRTWPSGITIVREMENLEPLEFKARFDVSQVESQKLKESIREMFFWDQLQMPNGAMMTATEVERRVEIMQRVLGPTLGRLDREAHAPMIERAFGLMYRKGALPPAPQVVVEAAQSNGGDFDIRYEGPLARAQRSSELASIQRFQMAVAPVVQMDPTSLDVIDNDEIIRMAQDASGVNPKVLKDPGVVQEIRKARNDAAAARAKQEEQMMQAETAGKMAPLAGAAKDLKDAGMIPEQQQNMGAV